MSTRVVLVEDDRTIAAVVGILLSTEPDFELVGTAVTAEEGISRVQELQPDLVLLDNQLAGAMTGLQSAPMIKQVAPPVLVLLCTALDLAEAAAREPAIDGYLRKDNLVQLVEVMRRLLAER